VSDGHSLRPLDPLLERLRLLTAHAIDAVAHEDFDGLRFLLEERRKTLDEIDGLALGPGDAAGALAAAGELGKELTARLRKDRRRALEELLRFHENQRNAQIYRATYGGA
jgi:hypothetical protein